MTRDVIVIGGGFAGMNAAYRLAQCGARPLVLEAAPYLGGRFATVGTLEVTCGGHHFQLPREHGLHGIWRSYTNARRLFDTLGLRLAPTGRQAFLMDTERGVARATISPVGVARRLPPPLHMLPVILQPGLRDTLRRPWSPDVGRALVALARLMAEGPISGPVRTLLDYSADWPSPLRAFVGALAHSGCFVGPDLADLEMFRAGLAEYALRRNDSADFGVLEHDPGAELFPRLVGRVEALGGAVRCNARVTRVVRLDGGGFRVSVTDRGDAADLTCTRLVVALDPVAFEGLGLREVLRTGPISRGVGSVVTRLLVRGHRAHNEATCGVVAASVIDNFFWLSRLQAPFAELRRATGADLLEVHSYGHHATRLAALDDPAASAEVTTDVQRVFGGNLTLEVLAAQRNAPVHPAFNDGTFGAAPPVAAGVPGAALCGDWIGAPWPCFFLERAALTGELAAAHVLGRAPDIAPRLPSARTFDISAAMIRGLG